MKKHFLIAFFLLFFCLIPFKSLAANLDIVINEITWMGTTNSANDEWVELYNNTDNSINLGGWQLIAQDGTPKITLSGIIPANGFYLLERTNDETVSGISADLIYKGAAGNDGENLKLYDNSGNLIDEVNCQDGWPAGDNKTKQTMERTDSGWQTSQESGGTPKAKNSIVVQAQTEPQPKAEADKPAVEAVEARPQQTYPSGIIFNEILPSPLGPDEKEEWIELYNENNFDVNLSGWEIKDLAGSTNSFVFKEGSVIGAKGFLVLFRPETKITLNNEGDGLEIIRPDGKKIDSVNYEKALRGQSYNKTASGWDWRETLTPREENIISLLASEEKEREAQYPDALEAAVINPEMTTYYGASFSHGVLIFLIALFVALFSGILILILKKRLKIS